MTDEPQIDAGVFILTFIGALWIIAFLVGKRRKPL